MRLWIKVLIGALALVLVLVAGAALFISQLDPNQYRGEIADLVEDATGRELHLGGDLRIKLLPVLSVEANDVTFANAPWASQPDMVRAKRVRADVALLPLLKGRIVVQHFVAIELEVFLETDAEGRGNWQFGDEDASSAETGVDTGAPSGELDIVVTQIRIEKAGLDYLDGKTRSATVLDVDELKLGTERVGGRLALTLRATYQDLPVTLDGRLGTADAIRRNQPIEVDLKGALGDADFTVQGAVGKPLQGKDLRLDVTLKSESTKKITDVAGAEVEEIGPVDLELRLLEEGGYFHLDPITVSARLRSTDARISGSVKNIALGVLSGSAGANTQNKPVKVDLEGSLGELRFSVVGDVGNPVEGKDLRLNVALETKSTRPLTELAGVEFEEIGPVNLTLTLLEQGGHYDIDDIKITARPRDTEARMSGSVKNLVLDLDGAEGQRKPAKVNLEGALGEARFTVTGDVGKPMEGKDLRLNVALETKSTKPLTELAGVEFEEVGPVHLKLTLIEQHGHYDFNDIQLTARPRDFDVSVSGSVKNFVLDLDGEKAQTKPATVNVKGTIGGARFSVAGDVARPMQGKDLRLKVALQTKSTRPFTELAGVEVEELGPLDVALTVIEKGGRFDLDGVNLKAWPRDADVAIKGSVKDVAGNPRLDLDVALAAKTLRQLDKTLPDAGPVSVSAKVRSRGKVVEIRDLVAKVGKSDLSGSVTVDTSGELPRVSAKLRASVIDLAELVPPADKSDTGAAAEMPRKRKIFPGDPLPLDALKKANGNIELAVDRLITPKLTLYKVNVAARLDNGNLTVKPAAHIAGGTVGATIGIDARTKPAKFTVDVDAKKVSIGALTKEIRGFETSKGLDSNLKMKLSGQGDSVRALMGGLDGDIRLEIGEGHLNNDVLDRVGAGLLTQIIGIAVPTDEKDKTTTFNCGVVRFAVKEGDAIADETLVMETDKVLLKGGGLIDLKTEDLDLGASLAARKGIRIGAGTLSSLVRVKGTLAEPQLGTDLKRMVKTGAKVGIAVATVGLSLLAESVYGYISEDDHPCQTALARQIEVTPKKDRAQSTSGEN